MAEQLLMWGMIDERALVNTDTRKARTEIGLALLEALCKNSAKIIASGHVASCGSQWLATYRLYCSRGHE